MLHTRTAEFLKPFIVSGVSWSVKLDLATGTERHNGILMSLLLLVAHTKASEFVANVALNRH